MSKVAVITRTRNRPILLKRAIESVLAQQFPDWIHVIVNDGGDPASVQALISTYAKRYQGRVLLINRDQSTGMQDASNAGIQASDSRYIAIHDDDDAWSPLFLRRMVDALESPHPHGRVRGVVSQSIEIVEEINSQGVPVEIRRGDYYPFREVSLYRLTLSNLFPPIAFLYDRDVFASIGYYNQTFNALGDWDFNLRFAAQFEIAVLADKLAYYHVRPQLLGSAYGNSIVDGLETQHVAMGRFLRNEYLRMDIAAGRFGLGFLMNIVPDISAQSAALAEHRSHVSEKMAHLYYLLQETAESARRFHAHLLWTTIELTRVAHLKRAILVGIQKLRSHLRPPSRTALPTHTVPNVMDESPSPYVILAEKCPSAAQIWLDIFDTLVLRTVNRPIDVFLLMQPRAREILGMARLDFQTMRVQAEELARQYSVEAGGTREIDLSKIYDAVQGIVDCAADQRDALLRLEMEYERRVLVAMPGMVNWLQSLNGSSYQMVSDMYLGVDQLRSLLEPLGLPADRIAVSADHGVTKYDGTLFDTLLSKVEHSPCSILHVGDHPISDGSEPGARGMQTVAWRLEGARRALVDQSGAATGSWTGDVLSSLCAGFARVNAWQSTCEDNVESNIWERLGYQVAGPLFVGFTKWLLQRALQDEIRTLYFLSRDGYHLARIAGRVIDLLGLPLQAKYLYGSRRLWCVAATHQLGPKEFNYLLHPDPGLRVRDFFERVDLPVPTTHELHTVGLQDLDQVVTTPEWQFIASHVQPALAQLIKERESLLLHNAASERNRYRKYLLSAGLDGADVALVDLGWSASAVPNLSRLLSDTDLGHRRIKGYYFATWANAHAVVEQGYELDSYYCHLGKTEWRAGVLREGVEVLESIFGAPHGSVQAMHESKDGQWTPEYGESEWTPEIAHCMQRMHASAHQFVDDLESWWPDLMKHPDSIGLGYLDKVLERLLRHPTVTEAAALGAIRWRSSFGAGGTLRPLAIVPGQADADPSAFKKAYQSSFWKRGFLAQVNTAFHAEIIS